MVPTTEQLISYLDQIITLESAKLVGKTLKRVEIVFPKSINGDEDPNVSFLKKEIRELIYESFRDMRDIFFAYGKGLEVSIFNLKTKSKEL